MSSKKSLSVRLFANWPAKILSLAAALLVFLLYHLNRLEERFVSVPLTITLGQDYVPSTPLPRSVRLTLRGEPGALVSILEDDLQAQADLSQASGEGIVRASIVVEKKGSALGVDPLEITVDPVEVTANLERKARKLVPITPSFRGYLEPGYELTSFDLSPSEAEIMGPASAVARALDLSTDSIELSGRTEDFDSEVRVFSKDPLLTVAGKAVSLFRATVRASIDYRRFEGVTPTLLGLMDGLTLADPPPACSLRLQSSKAQLKDFELPPGIVELDLSSVRKPGTYTLPLSVRLPEGFALDEVNPQNVTVKVVQFQRRLKMILGIGIDVVHVRRIRHWLSVSGLVDRFFHPEEITMIRDRGGAAAALSLAARFAAKEAFGKAIGTGLSGISLRDIQVINNHNGKPEIRLYGTALARLEAFGGKTVHISLTHESDNALAVAVIEA